MAPFLPRDAMLSAVYAVVGVKYAMHRWLIFYESVYLNNNIRLLIIHVQTFCLIYLSETLLANTVEQQNCGLVIRAICQA